MVRGAVRVALVVAAVILPAGPIQAGDLLVNGNFDGVPLGTGWTQVSDPLYPPIVTGSNLPPFSLPASGTCLAWMGGITAYSDNISQDIAVPAGTTQLDFSGLIRIASDEFGPATYDFCRLELVTPSNVLLETIRTWSNPDENLAWSPFTKTLSGNYAGTTVRIRISSSNDESYVTSFLFDSCVLTATVPVAVTPILPGVTRLVPFGPNPTRGGARWRLELSATEAVNAGIYDLGGRLIRRIAGDVLPAGDHDLRWDGAGAEGRRVAAGVYVCFVEAGGHRLAQRVAIIR